MHLLRRGAGILTNVDHLEDFMLFVPEKVSFKGT